MSTLDELLTQARTIKMTQAQEREQRLDFAYGNLAASSNHKPQREVFCLLAVEMGMLEVEFDAWAGRREWWSATPLRQEPPPFDSCACDGAFDDGCYNCKPAWRCDKCGFPLVHHCNEQRRCLYCAGRRLTNEEWRKVAFTGWEPS